MKERKRQRTERKRANIYIFVRLKLIFLLWWSEASSHQERWVPLLGTTQGWWWPLVLFQSPGDSQQWSELIKDNQLQISYIKNAAFISVSVTARKLQIWDLQDIVLISSDLPLIEKMVFDTWRNRLLWKRSKLAVKQTLYLNQMPLRSVKQVN